MFKHTLSNRGETLAELMVATFIMITVLFVILSTFIGNRQSIHKSWENTGSSEIAASVLESMKATPYSEVKQALDDYGVGGEVTSLDPKGLGWDWVSSDTFAHYEIEVDLLSYLDYPADQLIAVAVRVREVGDDRCNEKATLLRNEGGS